MAVIGIGIDAVTIERIRSAIAATPRGQRFRERVFTGDERRVCEQRRDPAESYAARFAAKEAVMKALGAEGISWAWRDIEVVRDASGAPSIAVHGRVAARCDERGVRTIHVSLTHADPLALASVVLEN